jgi:pimeloyl-ACP methyl ester carboxylesterase
MDGFELPITRYALSADVSIAYQVMGDGPVDLILVPGFMSHIEFQHELAGWTAFLRRLSKFARVVTFDKRGQGLSDRISDAPSLEQRMDDVRAIMDAIGSKRATLFGHSEGCAMSVLFAATYRKRVSKLILFGGYGRRDLPDDFDQVISKRVKLWGTGATMKRVAPSLAANADAVAQFAKFERLSASPGALRSSQLLNARIDVSSILPTVRVPTLVLHRQKDVVIPVDLGRELAAQIHDAKFIEYPGEDHVFFTGDVEALLGDIEEFVTGHRDSSSGDLERGSSHGAVYRYRRFHAQRRRDRRPGLAKIAGQSRSVGDSDRRKASRYFGPVDWRRVFGEVRWTGPRSSLRVGFWRGGETDWPADARRPPYWRN